MVDTDQIRERLSMHEVGTRLGVEWRRLGADGWTACCPLHAERSPSFSTRGRDHVHCFGCGFDGDIFALWREVKGCDFPTAARELAELAELAGVVGVDNGKMENRKMGRAGGAVEKVAGRELRRWEGPVGEVRELREEELAAVAADRGLGVEWLAEAARGMGRIFYCPWPLDRDLRPDGRSRNSYGMWSALRYAVQFRRIDGQLYEQGEGDGMKGWTARGTTATWPVGVEEIGDREGVLWCEGGPDILAGMELVGRCGLGERVAVCGMFGGTNRIHPEALKLLRGKRVRIMADADEPKETRRKVWREGRGADGRKSREEVVWMESAGLRDAAIWQEEMRAAGVVRVDVVDLGAAAGVLWWVDKEGQERRVKDVNDLVRCGERLWGEWDVRGMVDV